MNRKSNLDLIREKCIEANESIKDLVFGCAVSLCSKSNPDGINGWKSEVIIRHEPVEDLYSGRFIDFHKFEITKVIGRDIRLDDCLQLMGSGNDRDMLQHMWKVGLLQDQDDYTIQFIVDNKGV
jgi:hypothetical protein